MRRLPNGSVYIINSPVFIEIILILFSGAMFASGWVQLQHSPPRYFAGIALGLGGLIAVAGMLAQQKRTYLFDPSVKRLTWTRRGFFKSASGSMPFTDISEVRIETLSDNDGVTYRAALVTPAGSLPLSNAYVGNQKKVAEFAASIIALIGRDPTQPINVVDQFGQT
jgi:hypothetical protein